MKIDSMDANFIQPSQPTQSTSGFGTVAKGVDTATQHVPVHKAEGAQKEDLGTILQNKPISEMTEADKEKLSISEKTIIDAIEKANKAAIGRNTTFRFSIHEATHRISVKVLDKETSEVIREIPPEKVLDMVAKMWEMSGLFVDEKR